MESVNREVKKDAAVYRGSNPVHDLQRLAYSRKRSCFLYSGQKQVQDTHEKILLHNGCNWIENVIKRGFVYGFC